MGFFKELSERWTVDSPVFFVKLMKFGNWLTATGIGLIALPAGLEEVIPKDVNFDLSLLLKIASYMVMSGLIISIVAKLPKDDKKSEL